jgi:MFS family permease
VNETSAASSISTYSDLIEETVLIEETTEETRTAPLEEQRGLRRAVHALRDPTYRAWFACQVFSSSGSMTQGVAQSWLVLQLTGHALDIGYLGALSWAPTLLGGAWAGAVVDRFDQRRLLIATQSLFIALCAAQTALVATGTIRLWMILVFGALNGTITAVDGPARQVYVFHLVGPGRLASAVGLYEVMINASRVIGPATGGLLLATVGIAACFAANGLSYVPTLWMLLRLRQANAPVTSQPAAGSTPAERAARPRVRVRDGLAVVWRQPEIRTCILIAAASGMLFNLGTTTPLFAQQVLHLSGGGFGALMACFGIGAVPGALMAAGAGHDPGGPQIRNLTLLASVSILATALTPVAAGAFVGIALTGFFSIWLVASANTLVQLRSEPHMRGRIMGIWTMALPGALPVTGMLSALAAEADARAGVGLAGVAMALTIAVTWRTLGPRVLAVEPAVEPQVGPTAEPTIEPTIEPITA